MYPTCLHSPFITRNGVPLWEYSEQNLAHAARFAKAMAGWANAANLPLIGPLMSREAPWDKLRRTVLDVEGGNGLVSVALGRHKEFPHLHRSDNSPDMPAESARAADLGPAKGRVRFTQHGFFEPQPVRDASAVITRQATHNWTDDEVVKIFKGSLPTLQSSKAGTPVLINDIVLPEPGETPLHVE
ncbi:hypothetical protein DL767_001640 [Monosporascus sp. MG133]|nr:hypothetical protein DL767_001640 [Monosporascus sp. MG133]